MGREIRRVPPGWEHPKDERGRYIPLYSYFPYNEEEVTDDLREDWLTNTPPHYGCDIMPPWNPEDATHYQMYENMTAGTPISPVMDSPEALARWMPLPGNPLDTDANS